MRAEELRVGNLVFDGITNEKVSSSMLHYGWRNENYKGIPLTEEWLLKFGFVKYNNNYDKSISKYKKIGLGLNGDRWYYGINIKLSGYYSDMIGYLDYVHQLQNLYFALTGEELKIQENA